MSATLPRTFIPGSSWLYLKIYCGYNTADRLLATELGPFATACVEEGLCTQWFFIRYGDPDAHLRIRFYHPEAARVLQLLPRLQALLQPYVAQDLVWKVQLDTYQRELERYGPQTMELAEAWFYADSVQTVRFLDMVEGPEGEALRWQFGLKAMDVLLDTYGCPLAEKLELMEGLKTGFGKEFHMDRSLKKQLDQKYRAQRATIEAFMADPTTLDPDFVAFQQLWDETRQHMEPTLTALASALAKPEAPLSHRSLLGSLLHMMLNRLFSSQNRLHELVCYDFLYRHYRSQAARQT